MNKPGEQTLVPDRWVVRLSYFGICFFGALAVLSIGLAISEIVVTPEEKVR
jgi:hypothetical protein